MRGISKSAALKAVLAAGVAAGAIGLGLPAAAQDDATEVEEIVVTARKREEALKDVPISVSAFGSEVLEQKGAQNLVDVAEFTPGVQIQPAFGRDSDRPVIRGASNILVSDGKVGVFIDGIPYFGDFSSLDLDQARRVEVIKGPQSAVFGRGTLSGAINVVTRRPNQDFAARVSGTAGTDRREVSGYVSGGLTDWLAADIGFRAFQLDGQYDNAAVPGDELGGQSTAQLYGGLYLNPTPNLDASIRFMHQQDDDDHYAVALQPSGFNNCFQSTRSYYCGEIATPKTFALNTNRMLNPGLEREADRLFGDVNWDIGGSGYTVSYQFGYSDVYESFGYDATYDNRDFFLFPSFVCNGLPTPNRVCTQTPFMDTAASQRETSTHEVRLSSPGDQAFRWRVGVYAGDDEITPLKKYLEITQVGPDPLGAISHVENRAIFGGVDFDITDKLTVGLEVRYQEDDVTSTNQTYRVGDHFPNLAAIPGILGVNPNAIVGTAGQRNATFENTLPRATITYEWSDDLTFYGQYAVGNSPGGFNDLNAPVTTYDEETLTNFEVGAKTSLWGWDYLNLSLFQNRIENQVLTNTFVNVVVLSYRANIGETEVKGLEFEGARELFIPGLDFRFSYSYLDAEITEGVDGDQAVLRLGAACKTGSSINLDNPGCRAAGSIVGKEPPLVSRHLASLGLRYQAPTTYWEGVDWFIGGDMTYRGEFFEQVHNNITIPAAKKFNFQIGLQADNGLRATLWGRNVFDDDTPVGVLRYVDFPAPTTPSGDRPRAFAVTAPRKAEWGLTLTHRF